jgi:hypothetical protein
MVGVGFETVMVFPKFLPLGVSGAGVILAGQSGKSVSHGAKRGSGDGVFAMINRVDAKGVFTGLIKIRSDQNWVLPESSRSTQ